MSSEYFDYLFKSYENSNVLNEDEESELSKAKNNTKRLLVPNFKFMNLYKTVGLPKYELRTIEVRYSDELKYIEGLNFSIDDGSDILLEPIRIFLEKDKIYIGHLPLGLEKEVSEFIISYLDGIEKFIDLILNKIPKYNYFSWDKSNEFRVPIMDRELDFCKKELILKKNWVCNKFYPKFKDKPEEESISFYRLFKYVSVINFIKYLKEEPL